MDWLVGLTQESGEYYRRKAETRLLLGIPPQTIINDAASLTKTLQHMHPACEVQGAEEYCSKEGKGCSDTILAMFGT